MSKKIESATECFRFYIESAADFVERAKLEDAEPLTTIFRLVSQLTLDEGKKDEVYLILRLHFPEYFTDYKPFNVQG